MGGQVHATRAESDPKEMVYVDNADVAQRYKDEKIGEG